METLSPDRTLYDVQRDLDLDDMLDKAVPPPTCEWQTTRDEEPCGVPATWIMSLSCGHSYYYDDEHVAEMRRVAERPGQNACNNPGAPRHRPMVRVSIRFDRIAS